MNVRFIASVAVVAADSPQSRKLFIDALGLPLEGEGDGYYSSGNVRGSNHFGVWPLSQAAEACFGKPDWPVDRAIPRHRSRSRSRTRSCRSGRANSYNVKALSDCTLPVRSPGDRR